MAEFNLSVSTHADFHFGKLKNKIKARMEKIIKENKEDAIATLKSNIVNATHFKSHNYIGDMTRSVRLMRGRTGTKPLQDTGKLLDSIKATKTGIQIAKYGKRQHDGFSLESNSKDGKFKFYAPRRKAKARVLKIVPKNKLDIPARPWIVWSPNKKAVEKIFNGIIEDLSIPEKMINRFNIL